MDSIESSIILKEISRSVKANFLSDVPIGLRRAAIQNVHQNVANKVFLFKDRDPSILARMIPKLAPFQVKRGQIIYDLKEYASHVYVLFQGRISMVTPAGMQIKQFIDGAYFGETEVLLQKPRRYATIALEDSTLAMIEKDDFEEVMKNFPELKKDVVRASMIRDLQMTHTTLLVCSKVTSDQRPQISAQQS